MTKLAIEIDTNKGLVCLDGNSIELTKEQKEQLGIATRQFRDRCEYNKHYWFINTTFDAMKIREGCLLLDDKKRYETGNYYPCEDFTEEEVQQIAWRKELNSRLEAFNMRNGNWKFTCDECNFYIAYDHHKKQFIYEVNSYHETEGVCFEDENTVNRAIYEVVNPFMEEHKEFVWG